MTILTSTSSYTLVQILTRNAILGDWSWKVWTEKNDDSQSLKCYVSKVQLFNDSFVYSIPLSSQVFLLGRKWENIVEMYISSSQADNIF